MRTRLNIGSIPVIIVWCEVFVVCFLSRGVELQLGVGHYSLNIGNRIMNYSSRLTNMENVGYMGQPLGGIERIGPPFSIGAD